MWGVPAYHDTVKLSIRRDYARDAKRSVVLTCSAWQTPNVIRVIREQLDPPKPRVIQKGEKANIILPVKYAKPLAELFSQAERSPVVSRLVDTAPPDLTPPPEHLHIPGMVGSLLPFQVEGTWHASRGPSFLIHDDMGLGKTIQALAAVALKDAYPCLVVCPNTVKGVWQREIARFFPDLTVARVEGTPAKRREQITSGAQVVVINYESLRLHPELGEMEWGSVVLDEHHRVKNAWAKMTQAIHRVDAPYRLLLSGTPILNGRLEELWSPLHYAFPEVFPGNMNTLQPDWMFRRRYCIVRDGKVVAYRRVDELRKKLHERSIRRRKEDVLPDLPERVYSVREVDLTREQRKLYQSIKDEMLLWLDDGSKKRIVDLRVKVMRLKQACFSPELYGGSRSSAKLRELQEIVREVTASGHKVIIFSQWARATRIIARELGDYSMSYVDGKVTGAKRDAEIERFQTDPDTILYVGTIKANREGITLTAADYVVFTDLDWTPAYNQQAADRAHRIGQVNKVQVIELQAVDTVEERIARVLAEKDRMNATMTERGPVPRVPKKLIKSIAEII